MMNRTSLSLLLLLSIASACGNKRVSGSLVGACDERETLGRCAEYFGDFYTKIKLCPNGGELKECPKDGALLRCAQRVGKEDEWHALWYAPKKTKAEAEAMCTAPREVRAP